MKTIGIDTSNYTTSIALFDGTDGVNCSKLLPVKQGELGCASPMPYLPISKACRSFLAGCFPISGQKTSVPSA